MLEVAEQLRAAAVAGSAKAALHAEVNKLD